MPCDVVNWSVVTPVLSPPSSRPSPLRATVRPQMHSGDEPSIDTCEASFTANTDGDSEQTETCW